MMSKNSIVPFLKDYLIKFLTRPFLLDTNVFTYSLINNFNCQELYQVQGPGKTAILAKPFLHTRQKTGKTKGNKEKYVQFHFTSSTLS